MARNLACNLNATLCNRHRARCLLREAPGHSLYGPSSTARLGRLFSPMPLGGRKRARRPRSFGRRVVMGEYWPRTPPTPYQGTSRDGEAKPRAEHPGGARSASQRLRPYAIILQADKHLTARTGRTDHPENAHRTAFPLGAAERRQKVSWVAHAFGEPPLVIGCPQRGFGASEGAPRNAPGGATAIRRVVRATP
jgi:hypothetical protein